MKKLVSLLCALATLTSANMTLLQSAAEENPDLYGIASSLGANTDYLKIADYSTNPNEDLKKSESYADFYANCDKAEYYWDKLHRVSNTKELNFAKAVLQGRSAGIALLEVLSHNGVITPDDIQPENADNIEYLSDVTFSATTDKHITDYQAMLAHDELNMYLNYLTFTQSQEKQADNLISLAEKNMAEKKYFFISAYDGEIYHGMAGLGVAEGSWTLYGKTYDKCILTLSCEAKGATGEYGGFSDRGCIYVNSKTKEYYIPVFEKGSEDGMLIAAIDDNSLLNFKGTINPSEKFDTDITDLTEVYVFHQDNVGYELNVTAADGTQYDGKDCAANKCETVATALYYLYGDKFEIETNSGYPAENVRTGHDLYIVDENRCVELVSGKHQQFIVDDNSYTVVNTNDFEEEYFLNICFDKAYCGYNLWQIYANTDTDFTVKTTDEGVIFSGTDGVEATIELSHDISETPSEILDINAADSILIYLDENNDISFKFDKDNDGEFEQDAEVGDANYDGKIDSIDASLVLSAYAAASTGKAVYINEKLADYNNDKIIDASDASLILEHYAKNQTS